ncbi:MAG: tRNA (adenosine(37)-N6)-threonylcarbamoyltransferase complex ATPase subunit type 1 TsaE [Pseudomonadota bacterium]
MDHIGSRLAHALVPGDCITLSGQLGVGKSHLARATIRSILRDETADVPSPTYTLVNVFDAGQFDVWHADLYRLSSAEEIEEIGLADAVESSIAIIEWADRWPNPPDRRLDICITIEAGDARRLTFHPNGTWSDVLIRLFEHE